MGNPINHGTKNDFNIIVDLTYDKAGRRTSLRDPRGNLTEYDYDLLNRRVELTNPLSKTWTTAYTDLGGGGSRTTFTDPNGINTQRDFDRVGRVQSIQFGNPANTPDVQFAYDEAGNRERMSEFSGSGFTSKVRETTFTYDDLRRVTAVDLDTDGNGSVEESVAYEYDAAGLKTKMTLPGSLEITYDYDANGRLIGMTDWDAQASEFGYDLSGRHIVTQQDNGLRSRYSYDADGRLITLRHTAGERTLGHFAYHYDKRGNRIRAVEALPHPATTSDTTIAYNDDEVEYRGTWTNSAPYKQTTVFGASLKLAFFGTDATLTVGTGVNHTRFDIYINRQLWQTVDGYAASNGTLDIPVALENEGPHLLEIRNRPQHSQAAKQDGGYDPAVYKLQFKQLLVPDTTYDLHTIEYVYDALSRVEDVAYYAGRNLNASAFRAHAYTYDRLGNRLSASLNGGGATNYIYNAANQLTGDGTNSYTYDNNGNLTNDGVNTHTWDRANRLKSVGSHSYVYDGLGNRVKKTVSGTATSYLLDLHCSLTKVLAQTTSSNTDRVLHGPRGVQAFEDHSGDWSFMLPDALGSVRSQVDDTLAIAGMRNFEPYGDPFGEQGSFVGDYGFTGEQTDANDLLFLRARYYNPNMATFTASDPQEGSWDEPLTLNSYGYVGGNPINRTDPTGMFWDNAPNLMKPDGGGKPKPSNPDTPPAEPGIGRPESAQPAPAQPPRVPPRVVEDAPSIINDAISTQPINRAPKPTKPSPNPVKERPRILDPILIPIFGGKDDRELIDPGLDGASFPQGILASGVLVMFGNNSQNCNITHVTVNGDPSCTAHAVASATITSNGIISHDHWEGPLRTINYEWMAIRGINGTLFVPRQYIPNMLKYQGFANFGSPLSLIDVPNFYINEIGIPISNFYGDQNITYLTDTSLPRAQSIYFLHVPGTGDPANGLGNYHCQEWECIQIGWATTYGPFGLGRGPNGLESGFVGVVRPPFALASGDSGGGVFDRSGDFIGVLNNGLSSDIGVIRYYP